MYGTVRFYRHWPEASKAMGESKAQYQRGMPPLGFIRDHTKLDGKLEKLYWKMSNATAISLKIEHTFR